MDEQPSRQGKPLRFWLILLGGLAALCIAGLFLAQAHRQTGSLVEIHQDGQLIDTFPLNQDRTIRYDAPSGGYNVVVIQDGQVRITEASCPDQVCVRKGSTNQTADPIVCLPNQLVVNVITPGTGTQLDGVS